MTPALARRIALALMDGTFEVVADATAAEAGGEPVMEPFGVTAAELDQARVDRAVIRDHYRDLKRTHSYVKSALLARRAWLEGVTEPPP